MADVAINIRGSSEYNGNVVVGAPRGAGTDALGSKYIQVPGSPHPSGTYGGVNDAPDVTVWDTKYTARFDKADYGGGPS